MTFISFFAFGQKPKVKPVETTKPFVLGVIDEIQSKELTEKRVLNIYLPEGYNKMDTVNFKKEEYDKVKTDVSVILKQAGYKADEINFIPISGFNSSIDCTGGAESDCTGKTNYCRIILQ